MLVLPVDVELKKYAIIDSENFDWTNNDQLVCTSEVFIFILRFIKSLETQSVGAFILFRMTLWQMFWEYEYLNRHKDHVVF